MASAGAGGGGANGDGGTRRGEVGEEDWGCEEGWAGGKRERKEAWRSGIRCAKTGSGVFFIVIISVAGFA
jgi:hypothetical protein